MSNGKRISLHKHNRLLNAEYDRTLEFLRDKARRQIVNRVAAGEFSDAGAAHYWLNWLLGGL